MKRIVAIGSLDTFSHLLIGCFGTLSKYARNGDETHLLITLDAQHKTGQEKSRLESIQRAAKCVDISRVSFIEGFDCDAVSQNNVNLLRSFIEQINPLLVLIPSRKAINSGQMVLGSSAFLACRWIANILLYETDRNSNFVPTVFSDLSDREYAAKMKSIQEFSSNDANWHMNNKSSEMQQLLYDMTNKIWIDALHREIFESHRLMLLSANDVVA